MFETPAHTVTNIMLILGILVTVRVALYLLRSNKKLHEKVLATRQEFTSQEI